MAEQSLLKFESLKKLMKTSKNRIEPTGSLEMMDYINDLAGDIKGLQKGVTELKGVTKKLKHQPRTRRRGADTATLAEAHLELLRGAQNLLAAQKLKIYLLKRKQYSENGTKVS